MTCKMMHQICLCCYWSIEKWSKSGYKLTFWLILRVFLFTPSYTLWVTPQDFSKWKTLLRYISAVSFINIAYAVVELKSFKVFRINSATLFGFWGLMKPFWGFWDSYSPKYCSILLKFWPEVASIRQTQCLKNPSKLWILAQMKRMQSSQFWSILGPTISHKIFETNSSFHVK